MNKPLLDRIKRIPNRLKDILCFSLFVIIYILYLLSYILVPILCVIVFLIGGSYFIIEYITGKEHCKGIDFIDNQTWLINNYKEETFWAKVHSKLNSIHKLPIVL